MNYKVTIVTVVGDKYVSGFFESAETEKTAVLAAFIMKSGVGGSGLTFDSVVPPCYVFIPTEAVASMELREYGSA